MVDDNPFSQVELDRAILVPDPGLLFANLSPILVPEPGLLDRAILVPEPGLDEGDPRVADVGLLHGRRPGQLLDGCRPGSAAWVPGVLPGVQLLGR